MRDCSNVMMRDQLPDLLHGRLPATRAAEVRAHLDGCADCREELALLEHVRAASDAPNVDITRVAAAIPRYRAAPAWRMALRSPLLRVAAAIVLVAGGYGLWESALLDPPQAVQQVAEQTGVELSVGDTFQDLTDSDLVAVIERLGELEAVTPDATEEVVPGVEPGGAS